MKTLDEQLKTYSTLHWWNMGKKTLSFKGELKDLLKEQNISFTIKKIHSEYKGLYTFKFKSSSNITFKVNGKMYEFPHYAKQFIQMELVRMGDKSELYVSGSWRASVSVNK